MLLPLRLNGSLLVLLIENAGIFCRHSLTEPVIKSFHFIQNNFYFDAGFYQSIKMKRKLILFTGALFLFSLESCAPTKATFNSTASPDISQEKISSIAIMPFTGIKDDKTSLGNIDTTAMNALEKKKIKIKITGSYKVDSTLNNKLLKDWDDFSSSYIQGKNANGKLVSSIGKIFKVDGIIRGKVSNIVQNNAEYGAKFGDTKITLVINMFSSSTGKLLWTASSRGTVGTLTTNDPAPPVIDAVVVAVKKIFLNFPAKEPTTVNRNED